MYGVLQVSTADVVSYLEVRKKKQKKFHYLRGKGKSVFFQLSGVSRI